jgi:hypothetical protein
MNAASITQSPTTTTATSVRLGMMLTDLRLPTIKRLAGDLCAQSDTEGWPARNPPNLSRQGTRAVDLLGDRLDVGTHAVPKS